MQRFNSIQLLACLLVGERVRGPVASEATALWSGRAGEIFDEFRATFAIVADTCAPTCRCARDQLARPSGAYQLLAGATSGRALRERCAGQECSLAAAAARQERPHLARPPSRFCPLARATHKVARRRGAVSGRCIFAAQRRTSPLDCAIINHRSARSEFARAPLRAGGESPRRRRRHKSRAAGRESSRAAGVSVWMGSILTSEPEAGGTQLHWLAGWLAGRSLARSLSQDLCSLSAALQTSQAQWSQVGPKWPR